MKLTIVRTDASMPVESALDVIRNFLFGVLKGFSTNDHKSWCRVWHKLIRAEPGEMMEIEMTFPRSGPFHRRHMRIERDVFEAQERFVDFEQFRYWNKVGAGWVIWAAGPKGGVVPIPKSISYAKADELEFREFHDSVIEFFRGPHAAPFLWKHLGDKSHEMMNSILGEFNE